MALLSVGRPHILLKREALWQRGSVLFHFPHWWLIRAAMTRRFRLRVFADSRFKGPDCRMTRRSPAPLRQWMQDWLFVPTFEIQPFAHAGRLSYKLTGVPPTATLLMIALPL